MHLDEEPLIYSTDFYRKIFFGLALVALVILTPFSLNHFFYGRIELGIGSLVIILILAINSWSIKRGRYYPMLTAFGLVSAVVIFLAQSFAWNQLIGILWMYPAVLSFYFILPEKSAWMANIALLAVLIPLSVQTQEPDVVVRVITTIIVVSIFSMIFVRMINLQQEKIKQMVITDSLTGLYNRKIFHSSMEKVVKGSRQSGAPATILIIDFDHFKVINDTYGHDAGDRVLVEFSVFIKEKIRGNDLTFRIGGEEFLVLLNNTGLDGARQVAEKLRVTIESEMKAGDHDVTISIGLAELKPGESWRDWFKRADNNLYRAKTDGRNRVAG